MKIDELIKFLNERDYETDIVLIVKQDTGYIMELYNYMDGTHEHSEVIADISLEDLYSGERNDEIIDILEEKGIFDKVAKEYIRSYLRKELKATDEEIQTFKDTSFHKWADLDLKSSDIKEFCDIVNKNTKISGLNKYDIEYLRGKDQFMRGSEPLANRIMTDIFAVIDEYEQSPFITL